MSMIVYTQDGREVGLTENEAKFVRAVLRLEKIDQGRILLFGNGTINLRLDDGEEFTGFQGSDFYGTTIRGDGGDGGDFY